MEIGYSPETLWLAIRKQMEEVQSEADWLQHYANCNNPDFMEDCARNIIDSCTAILENIEYLKGKTM